MGGDLGLHPRWGGQSLYCKSGASSSPLAVGWCVLESCEPECFTRPHLPSLPVSNPTPPVNVLFVFLSTRTVEDIWREIQQQQGGGGEV